MTQPEAFRYQLAGVLDEWVSESLITSDQRQRIRQYYQLDQLPNRATSRFTLILMVLGSLLVGLGIVTFIAANWEGIPRSVRAVGALVLMIGLQLTGYRMIQSPGRRHRLGTGLLLVGELTLGATIGLMAQWFQVSGDPVGLYLAWGGAILLTAYCLRHTPSAVLALFILLPGFWTGYGWRDVLFWPYEPAVLPWLVVGLVLPLAYWCRSRLVWCLGVIMFEVAVFRLTTLEFSGDPRWITLGALLAIGILWGWCGWHQRGWPWMSLRLRMQPSSESQEDLASLNLVPLTVFLVVAALLVTLYGWTFWESWRYYTLPRGLNLPVSNASLATLVGLIVMLVLVWSQNIRDIKGSLTQTRAWAWSQGVMAAAGLSLMGLMFSGPLWGLGIVWVNFSLVAVTGSLIWQGLQRAERWRFWLGLLGLSLTVVTRFFEYESNLLLKSLALIVCGIGVITAGLRFERLLSALPPRPISEQ